MTLAPRLAALALLVALAPAARGEDGSRRFGPPPVVAFGAGVAAMEAALAGSCAGLETRRIEPPFLPDVRDRQMQIDCDGLDYRGAPRWAEFVFRDDALVAVWVLTTAEEEVDLLAAMTAAYGEPSHRGEEWFGFVDHLVALRRDKPELLFYSRALDETYRDWFDENVGD